ncbi:MAG: DUF2628 domain-containing protein [Acidobacteriota bacterium]|nr:DUF2628 domain-containing protein [Acidobacteriota bacterium]
MSNQPATFSTYLHPTEGPYVVKNGFSWPGSIFGFIWAFIKKMPTVGTGLLAVEVVHLLAQYYGSYFWAVTGVLNLGCRLVIGAYGNSWKRRDLEKRGYVHHGWVRAETGEAALAVFVASLEQASMDKLDGKITEMGRKMEDMAQLIKTLQENVTATPDERQLRAAGVNGLPDGGAGELIPPLPPALPQDNQQAVESPSAPAPE